MEGVQWGVVMSKLENGGYMPNKIFKDEKKVKVISTLIRYLKSKNKAFDSLLQLERGSHEEAIRDIYNSYFTIIFSIVDLIDNNIENGIRNTFNAKIKETYNTPSDIDVFSSIKKIRNKIIHAGLDVSEKGTVVNDKLVVLLPSEISQKDFLISTFGPDMNGIVYVLEKYMIPCIQAEVISAELFKIPSESVLKKVSEDFINNDNDIPEHVKVAFLTIAKNLDETSIHKINLDTLNAELAPRQHDALPRASHSK